MSIASLGGTPGTLSQWELLRALQSRRSEGSSQAGTGGGGTATVSAPQSIGGSTAGSVADPAAEEPGPADGPGAAAHKLIRDVHSFLTQLQAAGPAGSASRTDGAAAPAATGTTSPADLMADLQGLASQVTAWANSPDGQAGPSPDASPTDPASAASPSGSASNAISGLASDVETFLTSLQTLGAVSDKVAQASPDATGTDATGAAASASPATGPDHARSAHHGHGRHPLEATSGTQADAQPASADGSTTGSGPNQFLTQIMEAIRSYAAQTGTAASSSGAVSATA